MRCFVIMPVSTPVGTVAQYGGDTAHFAHVLEHFIAPAVERCGFELVPPVVGGADLIHAEIVRNLETAELVLCDLSALNPNVFFELGIRIALDRPVCLIKDDQTPQMPFDTTVVNCHTYHSELVPWRLPNEIEKLIAHIEASVERSGGHNALWQYFGLTARAGPAEAGDPVNEKLDYLLSEVASLRTQQSAAAASEPRLSTQRAVDAQARVLEEVSKIASSVSAVVSVASMDDETIVLDAGGYVIGPQVFGEMAAVANARGISLDLVNDGWNTYIARQRARAEESDEAEMRRLEEADAEVKRRALEEAEAEEAEEDEARAEAEQDEVEE